MTEIMPVPRILSFTVLPAGGLWAAFSVKGRVYYYDKPNIGSCLFFSFNIFLPIGEGVPAAFRGRGLQAEVKGGVLSTSFVVYCKNMDKV